VKVYVTTNGCEEGQINSAYVEEFFKVNDSRIVRDSAQADLVIFYACGLTKASEIDSLRVIRELKYRMKPSARLIVWGCLPKIEPRSLAGIYDGPIVGSTDLGFFEKILGTTKIPIDNVSANVLIPRETFRIPSFSPLVRLTRSILYLSETPLKVLRYRERESRIFRNPIYWIRVSTGCTEHCTYCSDRCAWGGIHSRPTHKVVSEFKRGLKMGYERFFLISSDLGAYGADIGSNLPTLLERMVKTDTNRDYKIVLNQINPYYLKNLYHDLEDIFDSGKIGLLGSQVQSGSNRILKLMGRRYAAEDWKECMQRIHARFPRIFLSTHLMVGFPTESDEDFEMTMKLLDKVFLDSVIVFTFSQRENVPASRLPGQVSPKVTQKRFSKLRLKADLNTLTRRAQRLTWR